MKNFALNKAKENIQFINLSNLYSMEEKEAFI